MEIQLTKTKSITIGGGPKKRKPADVVGVDLFGGDTRGCPAVRLTEKKGELHLTAVGFVPPPENPLPDSWEAAAKSCSWGVPAAFQAPRAAFAATSADMFLVQTTADAFKSDLASGGHKAEAAAAPTRSRLGIHRPAKASVPAPAPKAVSAAPAASALPEIVAGEPLSHGGTRFVMKPMNGAPGFVMEAGLPEYQLLWLSRLLPEGRKPTAASIQLKPSALAASILRQPAFKAAEGTAIALFISDEEVHLAGYRNADLVLWRRCRGLGGWTAVRAAVKDGLGLEDDMVEGVLDDTLIDPRPVLAPVLAPVLDELAVSRDYLVSKLGAEPKAVFVAGLPAGFRYWNALAEERAHLSLTALEPFAGIVQNDKLHLEEGVMTEGPAAGVFLGALGAALALIDEEAAS